MILHYLGRSNIAGGASNKDVGRAEAEMQPQEQGQEINTKECSRPVDTERARR